MKKISVALLLGILVLGGMVIGCTQTKEEDLDGQVAGFQDEIAAAMTRAAERAGVFINTDYLVTSSGIGGFVALAPTSSTQKSGALMYFSFARDVECSKILPPGFYVIGSVGSGIEKVTNIRHRGLDGPIALRATHDPSMQKLEEAERELHGEAKAGVKVIIISPTNVDVAVWYNTRESNTHIGM